jgi:hypothetical protein
VWSLLWKHSEKTARRRILIVDEVMPTSYKLCYITKFLDQSIIFSLAGKLLENCQTRPGPPSGPIVSIKGNMMALRANLAPRMFLKISKS